MPGLGHRRSTSLGKGIPVTKSVTGLALGRFFVNQMLRSWNKSSYYGFFFFRNQHAKTQNSAVSPSGCKTLLPEETRQPICRHLPVFSLVSVPGFATVTKYLCFAVKSA